MPRSGALDLVDLGVRAPRLAGFDAERTTLEGAEMIQALFEIDPKAITSFLPPAMHPSIPGLASLLLFRAPTSPWGPFTMLQLRIIARTAHRQRAFHVGAAIDNATAGAALMSGWAFATQTAEIDVLRRNHEVTVTAAVGDRDLTRFKLIDPILISPGDVVLDGSLHAARAEDRLILLQVEPRFAPDKAERARLEIDHLDAGGFGAPGLRPIFPVVGVTATGELILPSLSYAYEPDKMAIRASIRLDQPDA